METLLARLVANLTGKPWKTKFNGRNYYVAPMTLLVPGVLNGSAGPLYYPPEEVGRNYTDWNGMPIVVYHPTVNGMPVSARDPEILENQGVGFVFKSRFSTKLDSLGYFDEERTKKVDDRVHNALETATPLEISTGLVLDRRPAPAGAVFNSPSGDKPYTFITSNYRPDHLAVLPDQQGACSLADGCGVLANMVANADQLSHDELRARLSNLIDKEYGPKTLSPDRPISYEDMCHLMDVFDKRVVYYAGGQMWRVGYTTDQRTGDVKLSDEPPEKVRRVTTYKLVKNDERNIGTMDYSYGPFKEPDMNRTALISFLTTNCDCWRGQEETLNKMTDDQLNKLKVGHDRLVQAETVANAARQGFEHGDNGYTYNTATGAWEAKPKPKPPAPPVIPVAQPVPQPAPQNVPVAQPVANTLTEAEWLQTAPPGIRRAVQNSMSIEAREKSQLVERLTANVTDPEVKKKHVERLMLKDVPELTDLVSLLPEPVQNYYTPVQPGQTSYAGAQGAVVNAFSKEEKEEVLPLPIMNYEDETEEVA